MPGGFQNVEQIGSGIYRATDAGGQSFIVHGQPGEDLYNRYTSSQAPIGPPPPPAPTADVGGMPVTKLPGGGVSVPLSAARAAWKPSPEKAADTQPASTAPAAPGAQPDAAQGQQAPTVQAGPLGYTMKGVDPSTGKEIAGQAVRREDGSIGIYVPPVRGSAGGLTKLGKEALKNSAEAEQEHAKQIGVMEEARSSEAEAVIQEVKDCEDFLAE